MFIKYIKFSSFARNILILTMISISSITYGAAANHTGTISYVYPLSDGAVILIFKPTAAGCPRHRITVGEYGVTQEGLKNMLSVSLTAAVAGNTVNIVYDDETTHCYINRMSVKF